MKSKQGSNINDLLNIGEGQQVQDQGLTLAKQEKQDLMAAAAAVQLPDGRSNAGNHHSPTVASIQ